MSEFLVKSSRHFLRNDGRIYGRAEVVAVPQASFLPAIFRAGVPGEALRMDSPPPADHRAIPRFARAPGGRALGWCERLSRFQAMKKAGLRLLERRARYGGTPHRGSRSGLMESLARGIWHAFAGAALPSCRSYPPGDYARSLTVSPERFERHVRWLARRGYSGIRSADWLRWRREGRGLAESQSC